jgi:hypothetical protein
MNTQDEKISIDDQIRRDLSHLVRSAWLPPEAPARFNELTEAWTAANLLLDAYDEHGLRAYANQGRLIWAAEILRRALGRGE